MKFEMSGSKSYPLIDNPAHGQKHIQEHNPHYLFDSYFMIYARIVLKLNIPVS